MGDQVGLSLWVCEIVSSLLETLWWSSLIWITNVFRFSIVHRFWSVEEFLDPLKAGDNDFHPQGHRRGPPFYWPLYCCPVWAPRDRLPFSHWFTIVASKKPLWGQCLFSSSGSLPACCLVLAQVWAYQRQSSSVMLPNHFDTHLACSSEARYEYSQCCHGPVRGALEGMKITDRLFCVPDLAKQT